MIFADLDFHHIVKAEPSVSDEGFKTAAFYQDVLSKYDLMDSFRQLLKQKTVFNRVPLS